MGIFKKITEIFSKILLGYVFYSFPVTVIGYIILARYIKGDPMEFLMQPYYGAFLNTLIFIAMAQLGIWALMSLLFSITMFFSGNNREIFLKRLSGVKERDEREVHIVGKALRASYLTTLPILLFLLCISLFKVEVSLKSTATVEPGEPRGNLFIGIGFSYLDSDALIIHKEGYDEYFEYNGLPVSTSALILILLLWQIVSFRYISRISFKVPDQTDYY